MRGLLLVLTILASRDAFGFTEPHDGLYLDAAVGGFAGGPPFWGGPASNLGAGWWFGRYDDAFSIGKFGGAGVAVREGWRDGALVTTAVVELRRGFDVIVVGGHGFVAAGPVFASAGTGALVEAGGALIGRFRFTGPHLSLMTRFSAGAEFGTERLALRTTATAGIEFRRPRD